MTIDELVRRELADGESTMCRTSSGGCCSAGPSLRPDHRRVRRALDLVRWAAVHAPDGARAAPLCMAAWLAWALGMGSAAGLLVEQAVAADPGHSMAALLGGVHRQRRPARLGVRRAARATSVTGESVAGERCQQPRGR